MTMSRASISMDTESLYPEKKKPDELVSFGCHDNTRLGGYRTESYFSRF